MDRNPKGKIAKEMASIQRRNGGRLTPAFVLKFAEQNRKSAIALRMGKAGLWEEGRAARYGRLLFCQRLMLRVKVQMVVDGENIRVNKYISVITGSGRRTGEGYVSLVEALRTKGGRAAVLATALFELAAFEKKYKHLEELAGVFAEVKRARAMLVELEKVA
jgi:hypothetical protein